MLKNLIIFTAGVAIGGAAAWFYQEKKYESIINEEIDSVKKAFSEKSSELKESAQELAEKARNKISLTELTDYTNYNEVKLDEMIDKTYDKLVNELYSKPEEKEEQKYNKVPDKKVKRPYIIDQSDFKEFSDYKYITMDYYTDEILADADHPDKPINDIFDYVGNCLNGIGSENTDDWIYVRNEEKKLDMEIFINDKPFSEREE